PGGGSFGVQLPDGSEQTISTDSVTEDVGTWPYELSAGEQLRIQPQGDGEITILGQNNVGDGGGVRLHRLANGGWGVNNYLQRDWTFDSQLPLIDPDLFVIFLGQNDQGESAAGYKQKMQLLGQRLLSSAPDAELLFIGLNWSAGSNQLPLLVGAINEVADEGGHGFIGLQEAAGSHEFFEAQGYYDDGIHYSQAGGDYLGNLLFDAFANESLTAIPEPATLVIMAGGFACALRSRRGRGRRRANRELV
ncbi:MAG: hypothetical protein CMJ49_14465, partial [Planctomycetaceae bacterium]|nr:hypothetical protein [Planctomycetaceae bacterium]